MKSKKKLMALSLAITTFIANAEVDQAKLKDLVSTATEGGLKPVSMFDTGSNLIGVILSGVENKESPEKMVGFVTSDYKNLIIGKVINEKGLDISALSEQAYGALKVKLSVETSQKKYAEKIAKENDGVFGNNEMYYVAKQNALNGYSIKSIRPSNKEKPFYIFFDPDCKHCQELYYFVQKRPEALNIEWFPIALSEDRDEEVARFLESPTALEDYMNGKGKPQKKASQKSIEKVKENRQLLALTSSISTPTTVFKKADGSVSIISGAFDEEMLQQILESM